MAYFFSTNRNNSRKISNILKINNNTILSYVTYLRLFLNILQIYNSGSGEKKVNMHIKHKLSKNLSTLMDQANTARFHCVVMCRMGVLLFVV